jgi:hypothetical protein
MPISSAEIPNWIYGCLSFWLLASVWIGWRNGVVRQIASLAALGAAVFCGYRAGPFVAPLIPTFGFPVFLRWFLDWPSSDLERGDCGFREAWRKGFNRA